MKAVVLFGGTGTRVRGLSHGRNKALIDINGKPAAYYVLKNITKHFKEILIITTPEDLESFKSLCRIDFSTTSFEFEIQPSPEGVAHALSYSTKFLNDDKDFTLVLGDFYSEEIPMILDSYNKNPKPLLVLNQVSNPSKYGVYDFKNNLIVEKPQSFISNFAVRGFYILPRSCLELISSLKKSPKGELEITDLLNLIKNLNQIEINKVFDLGSIQGIEDFKTHLKS